MVHVLVVPVIGEAAVRVLHHHEPEHDGGDGHVVPEADPRPVEVLERDTHQRDRLDEFVKVLRVEVCQYSQNCSGKIKWNNETCKINF